MDNKIQSTATEMDEVNKKAFDIYKTEGSKTFIKHVMNPTGKKELTYAEMRSMFG